MPVVEEAKTAEGVDPLQQLHSFASAEFDLGDYGSFRETMKDPDARARFHKDASRFFDLGDFDSFENTIDPYLPKSTLEKVGEAVVETGEGVFEGMKRFFEDGLYGFDELTDDERRNLSFEDKKLLATARQGAKREELFRKKGIEALKKLEGLSGDEIPAALNKMSQAELLSLPMVTGVTNEQLGPTFQSPGSVSTLLQAIPKAAVAGAGQAPREGDIAKALDAPLVSIVENMPEDPPDTFFSDYVSPRFGKARKTAWDINKGVARFVEGFVTPSNIALGGAIGLTRKTMEMGDAIIPAFFSADMALQNPELVRSIADAFDKGDVSEGVQLITVTALTNVLAASLGKEAVTRIKAGKNIVAPEMKPFFDKIRNALEDEGVQAKVYETMAEMQRENDVLSAASRYAKQRKDLSQFIEKARLEGIEGMLREIRESPEEISRITREQKLQPRKEAIEKELERLEAERKDPRSMDLLRARLAFEEEFSKAQSEMPRPAEKKAGVTFPFEDIYNRVVSGEELNARKEFIDSQISKIDSDRKNIALYSLLKQQLKEQEFEARTGRTASGKALIAEEIGIRDVRNEMRRRLLREGARDARLQETLGQAEVKKLKTELQESVVKTETGDPVRVYHGTGSIFDTFERAKQSPSTLYGRGFYFTDNPAVASEYAPTTHLPNKVAIQVPRNEVGSLKVGDNFRGEGKVLEIRPNLASPDVTDIIVDSPKSRGEAANVKPAFLNIKNPFDIEKKFSKKEASSIFRRFVVNVRKRGVNISDESIKRTEANFVDGMRGGELYTSMANKVPVERDASGSITFGGAKNTVNDVLEMLGYDGIKHIGGNIVGDTKHQVWIAFKPEQIIPAFGKKGVPSTSKPSSSPTPEGSGPPITRQIPEQRPSSSPEMDLLANIEAELRPFVEEIGEAPGFFENVLKGLKETAKGINEILGGDPNTLASGLALFTEEGYRKSAPYFQEAWDNFNRAGGQFSEFAEAMTKEMGKDVEPFLHRFRSELEASGFKTDSDPTKKDIEFEKIEFEEPPALPPETAPEARINEHRAKLSILRDHERKCHEKLADAFSVESRSRRLNAPETGLAFKNFFSEEARHQEQALGVAASIVNDVTQKGLKPNIEALQEMPFIAESATRVKNMNLDQKRQYTDAIRRWNSYKRLARDLYNENGENLSLKQHILRAYGKEINVRKQAGENVEVFRKARSFVEKIKPSTLEASLFLERLVKTDFERASDLLIELSKKDEQVVNLRNILDTGLVKPSEINMVDIAAQLGRRMGQDIGALRIRKAATKEGLAVKLKEGEKISISDLYSHPPSDAIHFSGYKVHPALNQWLQRMVAPKNKAIDVLSNGISTVKMAAFINPLFLPMYDIVQAGMLNGPKAPLRLARGFREAFKGSDEYFNALSEGLASTPFSNPFESFKGQADHLKYALMPTHGRLIASALSNGIEISKRVLGAEMRRRYNEGESAWKIAQAAPPLQLMKELYNLSWGLAWQLDKGVRMASYLELKNQGFSSKDAAQIAARAHGDYASVPPETRKAMNLFLFTPTFKIAMAKFQLEMVRSALKGAYKMPAGLFGKDVKMSAREKKMATGLFYTGAILTGYHLYMLSQGFEVEEPFVKYKRSTVTEEGPKDIVVSFSNPANLYIKYWNRIKNSLSASPEPAITRLYNSFRWELTPAARIAENVIVKNRDDSGDPIVLSTDSPKDQFYKQLKYTIFNVAAMSQALVPDEDEVRARDELANDTGKLFELATRPFTMRYLKDPVIVIGNAQIQKLISSFQRDLREGRIAPEDSEKHASELWRKIEAIRERSLE